MAASTLESAEAASSAKACFSASSVGTAPRPAEAFSIRTADIRPPWCRRWTQIDRQQVYNTPISAIATGLVS